MGSFWFRNTLRHRLPATQRREKMTPERLKAVFELGETIAVEFKQCSGGMSEDIYKTVCSFLNRFGGDIYLGVKDNGTVCGVSKDSALKMCKDFINMTNNSEIISPTSYLQPDILQYEGKHIVYIHVPQSSTVHSYKKVIYDRAGDADIRVTSTEQIALMYIRKSNYFSERKVYPFVNDDELHLDMLSNLRKIAVNRRADHPWKNLTDKELLKSAGLYDENKETGQKGYNLAAVLLLGKDDLIQNICPTYRTDALLRKVNVDRYDDRVLIKTNLIHSYDLLTQFAEKHLLDKFYLEGDKRFSLRGVIIREMIVNTLIHREFTSSFYAKFVIEKDMMYTENATRALSNGIITPDNLNPQSRNPIIADFFRNIWLADELGSGVRKLHHYVPLYSGKNPEMRDGDVFRMIVPLDDDYSADSDPNAPQVIFRDGGASHIKPYLDSVLNVKLNKTQGRIIDLMSENPKISISEIAKTIGLSKRWVEYSIRKIRSLGLIEYDGTTRKGQWILKKNNL